MTPLPAEDVRAKRIHIRGTDPELALTLSRIRTEAERRDMSPTGLARDVLIDALEQATDYRSAARRKARRRPNTQPRPGKQHDQDDLFIPVSPDEHQHITALAADKQVTITDWAWGVLAQAMKPQRRKRQDASG